MRAERKGRVMRISHQHWSLLTISLVVIGMTVASAFPLLSLPQGSLTALESARTKTTEHSTSMPPRKAKHRTLRKKNSQRDILPQEQLAHHVAHQYLHGSGGVLRQISQKSEQRDEQSSFLRKLDRHPALLLNADYQPMNKLPLSLWHWQEAVKAVFSGKVTVVETYPNVMIRAVNLEIPLPSVIALNEYVPQFDQRPAFTKRNVFLRDEYRCQYCNDHFHTRDLSLDHVVPRCDGGRLTWENAVASCTQCNGRKGSLKVHQLPQVGMKLIREPYVPTQFQLTSIASRMLPKRVHPSWEPYLGRQYSSKKEAEFSLED